MDFDEFQTEANKTAAVVDNMGLKMCAYSMGLAGETGEVVDYIKKALFHDHDMNKEKVSEELGDVLWYMSMLASTLDIRLGDVARKNLEKLRNRYPDGFSSERSRNRVE